MKLNEQTISGYLALVQSDAPAPGGGSASALCGAQGAALAAMVAGLTIGRKKYAEFEEHCKKVQKRALALSEQLKKQIDLDTDAFNLVAQAFQLPKETDQQKAERKEAIASATLMAALVPFETLTQSLEALRLAESLLGKSNVNAASDLGVSALNLLCCARGAWLNVLINLDGINVESEKIRLKTDGQKMIEEVEALSSSLYEATVAMF